MIELFNEDNMITMARYPDNYFDLACVDPQYGIGAGKSGFSTIGNNADGLATRKNYGAKNWDSEIPPPEYFKELQRVSKNQVIWGGNYFLDYLGATNCFLVWDKVNGTWSNADCEIAWTSFKTAVRKFTFMWNGMLQGNMKDKEIRIHPTQKPRQLYKWIFTKYAKPGFKIIDTHLGSASSAIEAHYYGCDFVGCELDKDYYDAAVNRFNEETKQRAMF